MSASASIPLSATFPRKLRIAVFNRTFSPTGGGAERYSIALVEQLAARHEIHVFAQEVDHQWPGVSYHLVSAPLRKPRWINQLWFATATWWATRRGFDVVHSHENTWHGDVQTVHVLPVRYSLFHGRSGWHRFLRGVKVVTSPRLLTYLGLEHLRYAARPGRQVVVTSDSLRTIMAASYPASSSRLSVITPGITLPQAPVTPQRKGVVRGLLGLPANGPCLLFVANDFRKKGLPAVMAALAHLPAEVVLAVVGNAAQIPLFRERANDLKLGKRVFFLGSLKDVGPAYEAADCLVHPTLEDTFAMVVLEAMAHGLPVVVSASTYCGISGLLTQGANALILNDPQDVSALARSLLDVLAQPALATRLGRGAADFATHYQWRELALRQEALYFAVLVEKTENQF
ncbi:glycosyltransferase family 4 protein [Polaromonas sp.]|uniref:glycosyltransferase family 4 protein n=1 Tax=Polaromonas sp. TaxID=1869339 RepID=UPI0018126B87|nr:glycosyltransferase family 4 protein [Polaromonas sp.]NML84575.1 glycosyltransferase family 4 protein [Polaromonas sp.]